MYVDLYLMWDKVFDLKYVWFLGKLGRIGNIKWYLGIVLKLLFFFSYG